MKTIYTGVAGKRHKSQGLESQDFIANIETYSFSVTVLCDGAGSKEFGMQSARITANVTAKILEEDFYDFDLEKFIEKVNFALESEGYTEQNSGTTLLFVATDNEKYIIGHLGDGVILQEINNEFKVISKPENKEYVNTTFLLPSSDPISHLRIKTGSLNHPTAFILSTDGAAYFLYDPKTQTGYKVCKIFTEWARTKPDFECEDYIKYNLQEEFSKYNSDDMSIAVMVSK